ncbi:MAG TPA: RNA helicase, partial [Caulobacteraceae bacterium]
GKAPDEVTLDVDWSQAKTSSRPGGDRRGGASRDRRDRSRGRPASETSVAPMTPIAPQPDVDSVAAVPAEKETRPAREPRAERAAHRPKPPIRERAQVSVGRADEPLDSRVVGFGAETPAFLARAIPVPANAED